MIAPLVADDGVNPVVPPEKVETPVADVKYVFVSSANVPAAVIFTNGVPEDQDNPPTEERAEVRVPFIRVFALMLPVPIDWRSPAVFTSIPFEVPPAVTIKGFAVELPLYV